MCHSWAGGVLDRTLAAAVLQAQADQLVRGRGPYQLQGSCQRTCFRKPAGDMSSSTTNSGTSTAPTTFACTRGVGSRCVRQQACEGPREAWRGAPGGSGTPPKRGRAVPLGAASPAMPALPPCRNCFRLCCPGCSRSCAGQLRQERGSPQPLLSASLPRRLAARRRRPAGPTLAISVGGRTSNSTHPSFSRPPASLALTFCTLPSRICGGVAPREEKAESSYLVHNAPVFTGCSLDVFPVVAMQGWVGLQPERSAARVQGCRPPPTWLSQRFCASL